MFLLNPVRARATNAIQLLLCRYDDRTGRWIRRNTRRLLVVLHGFKSRGSKTCSVESKFPPWLVSARGRRDIEEGIMQGSCLCGAVEFRVEGIPSKAYQCHCSLCRKQGGTSSSLAILVETANFSWVTGREHISSYVRPTGFRSDFCARCGSPVPNPLRTTAYYWVPAGLLDDLETLEIGAHLFTGSKASWETIPSDAPHFETVPKLPQLLELLSS